MTKIVVEINHWDVTGDEQKWQGWDEQNNHVLEWFDFYKVPQIKEVQYCQNDDDYKRE